MQEMINGLLKFARIQSKGNPFSEVDMNYVAEAAKQNLLPRIDESKAEIKVSLLPVIKGDAIQWTQVVQNLIDNALKYSDDIPKIEISYTEKYGKHIFSVKDSGKHTLLALHCLR
jgi:light-regulated signal transduction histidine kinase (bacteriophytochrome)